MPSTSYPLLPPPDGHGPGQGPQRARRLAVVEDALAALTAASTTPDAVVPAHLHDYVNGAITLGQALGRIVDHRARAAGPLP